MSALPDLVAHADWSVDARKRWIAVAARGRTGWRLDAPEPVEEPRDLPERLRERAGGGGVLAGFDFPIGLPAAYAAAAGINDFPQWLAALGQPPWDRFADVCERPEEIGLHRPFYPRRPGGTRRAHLLDALGARSTDDLRRRCERATATRTAACPLFWTLGGNQVGKGALAGWRDLLAPALRGGRVDLWPFHGTLADLAGRGRVVVAETYPAEYYRPLGVRFPPPGEARGGKRSQAARRANGPALIAWAGRNGVTLARDLVDQVWDGFGPKPKGEDAFDAVVGALGMLRAVLGRPAAWEPEEPVVRRVEGWILGMAGMPGMAGMAGTAGP